MAEKLVLANLRNVPSSTVLMNISVTNMAKAERFLHQFSNSTTLFVYLFIYYKENVKSKGIWVIKIKREYEKYILYIVVNI